MPAALVDPTHAPEILGGDTAGDFLCHGVVWPGRVPHLALTSASGHAVLRPLTDAFGRLALRLKTPDRYCLGGVEFTPDGALSKPCPDAALVPRGRQCPACAARDVFRFAHHAHRGGHVPAELEHYLAQPHWVYLATFADGTSKVGTAVDSRKLERLDEQGAVAATWVVHTRDGRSARLLEDFVSRLGISQTKRHTAKLASLCQPRPGKAVDFAHAEMTARVRTALRGTALPGGAALTCQPWPSPEGVRIILPPGLPPLRQTYPHPLTGEHAFDVRAMVGSVALLGDSGAGTLVDLDALRGRRVELGAFGPADVFAQPGLF